MHVPFFVYCLECGHRNRPAHNARAGILLVLTGEFHTCRGCGVKFIEILVPKRPMVAEIIKTLTITPSVSIFEYDDAVPKAVGLIDTSAWALEKRRERESNKLATPA